MQPGYRLPESGIYTSSHQWQPALNDRMNSNIPLPNLTCPLCGSANGCAPAETGSFAVDCWCRTVEISAETLARVPPDAMGKACLCPRCAAGNMQTDASSGLS